MLFKNIKICNFGRYGGENFFDTTVTRDRNVILVKANNDRGKTTLFKAIKFALYGEGGLGYKSVSEWINMQKASEGDGEMYVEIKFEHEGNEYRLKHSIRFRKTEKGKEISTIGNPVIDIFENDKPYMTDDSNSNKKDWIDTILPKDASQFFFFDGEEIQRYIQNEETHVRQAIEKVLGIKEMLNAKEDLGRIHRKLESEYGRILRKNTKDEKSRGDLVALQNNIDEYDQSIEITRRSLSGAKMRKDELEKDLQKHKEIKDILDERNEVDDKLKELKKTLKTDEKNLAVARGSMGLVLLSPLLDIVNKAEEDPPSTARWQSDTARYILHNHEDRCVCDRPVDAQTVDALKSKILDLKPSKASSLKKFVNSMLIDHAPAAKQVVLRNYLEKVSDSKQELAKHKSTFDSLSQQIRNHEGAESIKDLEIKYESVLKDIGKHEQDLDDFEAIKGVKEGQKKTLESKIHSSVVDKQLQEAENRRDMCKNVMDCIELAIDQFYQTRKPLLENSTSNIFSSLTNNPDLYKGLKIDRDFSMKVVRSDGTELPTHRYSPSQGASQIVATSMIGGLNKFATKDAPIVIDTPMGRLDPDHRKNLINYYSKMSKQIIILYQPSELYPDDIQTIHDHLASEWEIDSVPGHPDISQIHKTESYYE